MTVEYVKSNLSKLVDKQIYAGDSDRVLRMLLQFGNVVDKELLIKAAGRCFAEKFCSFLEYYLENDEPFVITKEVSDDILTCTSDSMYKLHILHNNGFVVEDFDNLLSLEKDNKLPKPSITRHCLILPG